MTKARYLSWNKDAFINSYLTKDRTAKSLAGSYHCSVSTIRRAVKHFSAYKHPPYRAPPAEKEKPKEMVIISAFAYYEYKSKTGNRDLKIDVGGDIIISKEDRDKIVDLPAYILRTIVNHAPNPGIKAILNNALGEMTHNEHMFGIEKEETTTATKHGWVYRRLMVNDKNASE